MNRKQLLVVALVVGLLLIGWMLGQRRYRLHHELALTAELIPSEVGVSHPSLRPADSTVDATLECNGPLDGPDPRIQVISPGIATVGYDPWQLVFADPNPCLAESAARRRTLELEAAAVLLVGIIGLVALRTRSSRAGHEAPPTSARSAGA